MGLVLEKKLTVGMVSAPTHRVKGLVTALLAFVSRKTASQSYHAHCMFVVGFS